MGYGICLVGGLVVVGIVGIVMLCVGFCGVVVGCDVGVGLVVDLF